MPTLVFNNRYFFAMIVFSVLAINCVSSATAQTFNVTRLDGDLATPSISDPVIDISTFERVGGDGVENDSGTTTPTAENIDGPSIIRIPDWIPASERVNADAVYYAYFAHHGGDNIRLAWSASITGPWNLFNAQGSTAPDSSVGGTETPGDGVLDLDLGDRSQANGTLRAVEGSRVGITRHVASPDVLIDNVNQRIVLGFHSPPAIGPNAQKSFVATSKYGLNFNPAPENGPANLGFQGEAGQGFRDVILGESYFRVFQVGGQGFAYSNNGNLWQAPVTNDANEVNTLTNADSEGGWFNPSPSHNVLNDWWTVISQAANPLKQYYINELGEGGNDPRHFAIYTRTHLDPNDTNIYAFYSSKFDQPERIFLTVIDTSDGSTNPAEWTALGQELILEPELAWEGADLPLAISQSGEGTGVRELRDPYVFEDDKGTASTADDELFLFYTGSGEEAIGVAQLTFNAAVLLGDVNLDEEVNFLDIGPFIRLLASGSFQVEADFTGNGRVDFLDISQFIISLTGQ